MRSRLRVVSFSQGPRHRLCQSTNRIYCCSLKFVHSFCSPQASHLLKCLMSAELACVEYVDDVIKELEKQIEIVQGSTKANHKVAKVRHHYFFMPISWNLVAKCVFVCHSVVILLTINRRLILIHFIVGNSVCETASYSSEDSMLQFGDGIETPSSACTWATNSLCHR